MFSLHFVLLSKCSVAAFIWAKTKSNLKLTLIDDLIDVNCLKNAP